MKRSRLSYDEWKCIQEKKLTGKQINSDFFTGYIGILEIEKVSPNITDSINADTMYGEQLHEKLKKGYDDIENGNVEDSVCAFEDFREKHN